MVVIAKILQNLFIAHFAFGGFPLQTAAPHRWCKCAFYRNGNPLPPNRFDAAVTVAFPHTYKLWMYLMVLETQQQQRHSERDECSVMYYHVSAREDSFIGIGSKPNVTQFKAQIYSSRIMLSTHIAQMWLPAHYHITNITALHCQTIILHQRQLSQRSQCGVYNCN